MGAWKTGPSAVDWKCLSHSTNTYTRRRNVSYLRRLINEHQPTWSQGKTVWGNHPIRIPYTSLCCVLRAVTATLISFWKKIKGQSVKGSWKSLTYGKSGHWKAALHIWIFFLSNFFCYPGCSSAIFSQQNTNKKPSFQRKDKAHEVIKTSSNETRPEPLQTASLCLVWHLLRRNFAEKSWRKETNNLPKMN